MVFTVFFFGGFVYSAATATPSSELIAKFDQCNAARKNGTANAIDNFICLSSNVSTQQDIAFQIALDMLFRKIDTDIEDALQAFQTQKIKDPVVINNQLVEWFDMTGPDTSKTFASKYLAVCLDLTNPDNPLAKTVRTLSGTGSLGGVTTDGAAAAFVYGGTACTNLAENKLAAYYKIAYLIGLKGAKIGRAHV